MMLSCELCCFEGACGLHVVFGGCLTLVGTMLVIPPLDKLVPSIMRKNYDV